VTGFIVGQRVRVAGARNPELNGITGRVAPGRVRMDDVIVHVEVAGFMGEPCVFRIDELEHITDAAGGAL
jgi:RNase P/RNase MRP subunit p29